MKPLHFTLLCVTLFIAVPVYADIYRWVDESGVENFADAEWKVPEKYRQKSRVIREPKPVAPPEEPVAEVAQPSMGGAGEPAKEKGVVESPKAPSGPVDDLGHDEAWWRARVNALKQKKSELEKELGEVEAKISGLSTDPLTVVPDPDKPDKSDKPDTKPKRWSEMTPTQKKKSMFKSGRTHAEQQDHVKLLLRRDEIKKEIADIDYQLDVGLPDEARKARALPGWLR